MDTDEGLRRFRVAQRSFAAEEVAIRSEGYATASSRRVTGLIQQSNAVHRGQRPEEENVQIVHRFYHVAPPPLIYVRSDVVPRISDRALPVMSHHSAFTADLHLGITNTSQIAEIGIHEGIATKYRARKDPGVINAVAGTKYELPPDEPPKPSNAEKKVEDEEKKSLDNTIFSSFDDTAESDRTVPIVYPAPAELQARRRAFLDRFNPAGAAAQPQGAAGDAAAADVAAGAVPAQSPIQPEGSPNGQVVESPADVDLLSFSSSSGLGDQARAAAQGESDQSRTFDNSQALVLAPSPESYRQLAEGAPDAQASPGLNQALQASPATPAAPSILDQDVAVPRASATDEFASEEERQAAAAAEMAESQSDLLAALNAKIERAGSDFRTIGMLIWGYVIDSYVAAKQGSVAITRSQYNSLVLIYAAILATVQSIPGINQGQVMAELQKMPSTGVGRDMLYKRVENPKTRRDIALIAGAPTQAKVAEAARTPALIAVVSPGKVQRPAPTPGKPAGDVLARALSFASPVGAPSNAAAAPASAAVPVQAAASPPPPAAAPKPAATPAAPSPAAAALPAPSPPPAAAPAVAARPQTPGAPTPKRDAPAPESPEDLGHPQVEGSPDGRQYLKIKINAIDEDGRPLYVYSDLGDVARSSHSGADVTYKELQKLRKVNLVTGAIGGLIGNSTLVQLMRGSKQLAKSDEGKTLYEKLVARQEVPAAQQNKYGDAVRQNQQLYGSPQSPTPVKAEEPVERGEGKPRKRGRFEKGSAEAKAFMAELRAKRKKM
jgi:hypothetical protein